MDRFPTPLEGELDVIGALERRDQEAAQQPSTRAGEILASVPANHVPAPPRILWSPGTAPDDLIVQIRTIDRAGLLARLTAVFERDGVDVAWAKVTTLGASVVDVFCITAPAPASDEAGRAAFREELERDMFAILPAPPPAKPTKPVEQAG
ncbi:hypothetical protein BHQ19_02980 [Mycolicibacterium porcinum]|nr:hypothetical protein BHQ19_02980 [Mycolicibacterium porcinum]